MSKTDIFTCTCKNEYQDKAYGRNRRVFNQTRKSEGKVWRCTSCTKELVRGEVSKKEAKQLAESAPKK